MPNKTARRSEIEQEILKHMDAIRNLVMSYSPDDIYFSGRILSDGSIYFNNTHWELPEEQRINFPELERDQDD